MRVDPFQDVDEAARGRRTQTAVDAYPHYLLLLSVAGHGPGLPERFQVAVTRHLSADRRSSGHDASEVLRGRGRPTRRR